MGLLDRLRGKDTAAPPTPDLSSEGLSSSQAAQPAALELAESSYSAQAQQDTVGPSGRFYNPYEGINTAVDGRSLKGAYQLPSQPEFLFSEEATVHRRSWSENLTYYTGTGYLTGAIIGGGQGALGALQKPPEGVDSARLRLNRLLNMSGRAGRSSGNALGALGLFFSSFESGIGYLADGRTPDSVNSISAGFATGALFRAARGGRHAAVAGAVGATAAAVLVAARSTLVQGL